jgi:beta-lactamase regulating signal transducer with metallopeptidase domain
MGSFVLSVVSNIAVAGALALLAIVITRVWRNPHLAHALWLLVLLKLVTPPIVQAPLPQWPLISAREFGQEESDSTKRMHASAPPLARGNAASTMPFKPRDVASAALLEPRDADSALPVVSPVVWLGGAIWLAGALTWSGIFLRSYLRFRKLFVESAEANGQILADARRLAGVIGLARCPALRVVDARIPPLVWSVGRRPVILLSLPIWASFDDAQRQAVLLHELAHIRRRDHWVRWFELLVTVLYWWNPIVWWASRQIRQAEEECCDAWVVWALPECRRSYGQALLQTVEFLTESRAVPAVVGNAFGGFLFKRRIEMILKRRMNPKMSWLMWAGVLLLGAIVLPVAAQAPRDGVTSNAKGDKTRAANKHLEQRVSHLETMLESLQEAITTLTDSPESKSVEQMRVGGAKGVPTPGEGAMGVFGLTSQDYPLTDKEADPLCSLLEAFGNKHVYVWAYDREKGTASINTTAEGHRCIAALLQLLREENGDIHFDAHRTETVPGDVVPRDAVPGKEGVGAYPEVDSQTEGGGAFGVPLRGDGGAFSKQRWPPARN